MNNTILTNGKQVKVSNATHDKIYAISRTLREKTGLLHPASVVVANAVELLEKKVAK